MKKISIIAVATVAVIVVCVLVLGGRNHSPSIANVSVVKSENPSAPKAKAASASVGSAPKLANSESGDVRVKAKPLTGMTLALGTHETPVDYALVQIAYKHPEFHLKPEEAADLQEIFASNYKLFAGFQAKVAQATTLSDGSTQIQIPAFPTQGQQLVDGLVSAVQSYYNGNVPAGVMEAIVEEYRGFTNSAGQVPITLTVTVSQDPNYSYAVTRRTVFLDPVTGQVTGVGESKDVISKNAELYSPYSEFKSMFPKPRG